jgi:hypothetical protein
MLPNPSEPEDNSSHCSANQRFLIETLSSENCGEFVFTSEVEALIVREPRPEFWLFPHPQRHTPIRLDPRFETELWVRAVAQCKSTVRACYAMAQTRFIRCAPPVYCVSLTWHLIHECPNPRPEIVHPWAGPPDGIPSPHWEKD